MRTVGVSAKLHDARAESLARELIDWLRRQGREVLVDDTVPGFGDAPLADMPERVGLMVVLGGDGTLLHVARRFIGHDTPILGINLGRLGFLTEAAAGSMLEVVEQVLAGRAKIKTHFSLKAQAWRDGQALESGFAINDVVLQRNDHPRMIEFEMYVYGHFVFRLRADGLVLATPAGSTAYALSAGGPIVHPEVAAISVVPICPHVLSNRPVVLPASASIELVLTESPAPAALNLDGQVHHELCAGDRIQVDRADTVSLAYLPERHYFEVLRSKLLWAGHAQE
ncbi:MAG TPA: NAD(+)/NADH kinase [Mariprofundaceae bacterium]|nr:NAD(+)/NADH kinase [Mariprofundaceae bacterium]